MGNHDSLPSNIQLFKPQNWIEAGEDQQKTLFPNVNPYRKRLLANIVTHELIQEYELNFIAQQEYNNYVKQLSFRQSSVHKQQQKKYQSNSQCTSSSYIYPIKYFINKSKNQMCSTIHTGYLYIDKVDLRLKQINDIPFPDLLYMYKATLNGFKFLYQKVGYFDIQEQMIFITKGGEAKVWMNANLAKNYPSFQKSQVISNNREVGASRTRETQRLYGSQADMIKDLIFLVENNSDQFEQNSQVQLFSQFLTQKNILDKLSFEHCLEQFQMYLYENNLHSSGHMKSIPQLFSPDEHFNNNETNYEQSHVNQITTHHLHQMKKKFQPMQTIVQNQKTRPLFKSFQIQPQVQGQRIFYQSQVSKFTPQKFSNQMQSHDVQINSQKKSALRPSIQGQYVDLNNSRNSYQSNNQNIGQHQNLHKFSNSNSVHSQNYYHQAHFLSKANHYNGVQSINYDKVPQKYLPQPQTFPQHKIIQSPIQNNGISFIHPQFSSNQQKQRIFISSPPPSFRVMGGIPNGVPFQSNNIPLQQHQNFVYRQQQQQQPIFVPPPQNMRSNQAVSHHLTPQKNNSRIIYQNVSIINSIAGLKYYNENTPSKHPISSASQVSITSPIRNHRAPPQQSPTISVNRLETQSIQNIQKSKTKYLTTKSSYKLDQEIANDLEKFLGLKVN